MKLAFLSLLLSHFHCAAFLVSLGAWGQGPLPLKVSGLQYSDSAVALPIEIASSGFTRTGKP